MSFTDNIARRTGVTLDPWCQGLAWWSVFPGYSSSASSDNTSEIVGAFNETLRNINPLMMKNKYPIIHFVFVFYSNYVLLSTWRLSRNVCHVFSNCLDSWSQIHFKCPVFQLSFRHCWWDECWSPITLYSPQRWDHFTALTRDKVFVLFGGGI